MSYKGLGLVPAYVEVSHFRAPYKNAYLSGLGATVSAPNGAPATEDPGVEERNGVWYFTKDAQKDIWWKLERSAVYGLAVQDGSLTRVPIAPMSLPEIEQLVAGGDAAEPLKDRSAAAWAKREVAAGKAVLVPSWFLTVGVAPDQQNEIASVDASDKAALHEAASTPYVAVLDEPGLLQRAGMVGVAVGAVALVSGLALVVGRRRIKRRRVAFQ